MAVEHTVRFQVSERAPRSSANHVGVSESGEELEEVTEGEEASPTHVSEGTVMRSTIGNMRYVMDAEVHLDLRKDLISHLWEARGSSAIETEM